ncbi:MAG: PQQ-binding-like beta-propeller repeat protein [Bacillota bacterium]
MKTLKIKTIVISVALIAIITFGTIATLPITTKAQVNYPPTTTETHAFLSTNPRIIGVGQNVLVNMWVLPVAINFQDRLSNYTLVITAPDGTKQTYGPFTANNEAGYSIVYTPKTTGNYTMQFTYPGQFFASRNSTYTSSQSEILTLPVQQEPIPLYPQNPLPSYYWTEPINTLNRNWYSISGSWLQVDGSNKSRSADEANRYGINYYSSAPLSSHIMWTKPLAIGGVTGGGNYFDQYGLTSYFNGGEETGPVLFPPVIIAGNLYYNIFSTTYRGQTGFTCVDLHTGQTKWTINNDTITNGQVYNAYPSKANNGLALGPFPYLWSRGGTTWNCYDAFTGNLLFQLANATTGGFLVFGPNGEMDIYNLNNAAGWMTMWNSSRVFSTPTSGIKAWNTGIQYNTTIPIHNDVGNYPRITGVTGDTVVAFSHLSSNGVGVFSQVGYSLSTGKEVWYNNVTGDPKSATSPWEATVGDGVYAAFNLATMTWSAWDANTGKYLWTSTPNDYPFGGYIQYSPLIADGRLIYGDYNGNEYCINITNGDRLWTFNSGEVDYLGSLYGSNPMWWGPTIANGVVFCSNGYETLNRPIDQGFKLFAINETTGKEIWSIDGSMDPVAISDGLLIVNNAYDTQAYAFGQGPSKTTVSAPQVGVTTTTPITITGRVTDISAGSQQAAIASNFPNGLPAVSDASMGQFMEAVYEQQPMPRNITGVPVSFYILDSNNNYRSIGTTTTNALGDYSFTWTPDISGNYTIYSTFAGTNGYYSSSASTGIYASSPTTPSPTAAQVSGFATESTIMYAAIAIIVAIVIVGAILAMITLRKRA